MSLSILMYHLADVQQLLIIIKMYQQKVGRWALTICKWLVGFLERSFKEKLWQKNTNILSTASGKQTQISLSFLKESTVGTQKH